MPYASIYMPDYEKAAVCYNNYHICIVSWLLAKDMEIDTVLFAFGIGKNTSVHFLLPLSAIIVFTYVMSLF